MEMDTESLVQLVKSIDTINSRLQVLESSKFNAHLTEEKLLHLESFAGVINRKVDDIESYRRYEEKLKENFKELLVIIAKVILLSLTMIGVGIMIGRNLWN